jgi:predicted dehydrogenase
LVETVAVCDIDLSRAKAAQKQYGIPAAFDRLETMLQEARPDVVHVLLPPELHAGAAEECLSAGAHIFMEKPFCVTVDECERVTARAKRSGLQIGVNHNVVFMPAFLELIEAIRACRFGALEQVQVMFAAPMPNIEAATPHHWMFSAPGRIILEIGPHPLSMCVRLLGRVFSASTAVSGEVTLSNGVRFFKHWMTSLVCERGNAQLTFSVGGAYPSIAAHVLGEDAQAFVDIRRNSIQVIDKTPYLRLDDMVNGWKNSLGTARRNLSNLKAYSLGAMGFAPRYDQQGFSFGSSIAAFYRALAAGKPPRIDAAEGTAVVEACQMTIDSAMNFAELREERVAAV